MKNQIPKFSSVDELDKRIDAYFEHIRGERDVVEPTSKKTGNDTAPATLAGLAFYLGFNSREQFESYESKGKFAACIKRARLRIEEIYEKKLHQPSPTGAIFALKTLGWNEKTESKKTNTPIIKTLKVTIVETGPKPAGNEKDVML